MIIFYFFFFGNFAIITFDTCCLYMSGADERRSIYCYSINSHISFYSIVTFNNDFFFAFMNLIACLNKLIYPNLQCIQWESRCHFYYVWKKICNFCTLNSHKVRVGCYERFSVNYFYFFLGLNMNIESIYLGE